MEFTLILRRFFKNYVLRFFLITTLVNVILWFAVFPLTDILESRLYPEGTRPLFLDILVFSLPPVLICLSLFLRLRHPKASLERADAIMYTIILAILLVAGSITVIASGGDFGALAPSIVLWITSFPYAPSIIIWSFAFRAGSGTGTIIIAAYVLSTLAFTAITSWILVKKDEENL